MQPVMAPRWRAQLNRVIVLSSVLVGLPVLILAQWLRPGSGRRIALILVRLVGAACGVRIETKGHFSVDAGQEQIWVANHTSLLDIPALLTALPDAQFLAGADLFSIPVLGAAMRALGTVPVDRQNGFEGRRELSRLAKQGVPKTLVVFPQGGIGSGDRFQRFKTGAFALAIESGAGLHPLAIRGADLLLPPGSRLRVQPGVVVVEAVGSLSHLEVAQRHRRELRDWAQSTVTAALPPHASGAEGR
jgi:1-acyl-sn-glycerol-3-phosphate acyltransferase